MLVVGLVVNISILGTFKYLGFFASVLNDMGVPVAQPKIALPIGISFYTFQSISYLIDVYRRESPVQKRFLGLLLYISMFPQLIAGPIVRYGTVAEEIGRRHVSPSDFAEGIYRFLIGLGKKVILANQLSEIAEQFLVAGLPSLSTTGAWIGILAFTFQIYFDFSGYSDMSIGIGRCLGFHFNENFRHPYCCNSISDFWRRWHISLGSFFRDYVYIPMGGNRRHQVLNILVVWFLTGMWHGASWNFIIWGVYFGLIVMLEKYTLLKVINRIPSPLLHIYSLALVIIGWGIFYFDDFNKMVVFFQSFFGQVATFTDFASQTAITDNFWLWIAAIVLSMPVRSAVESFLDKHSANGNGLATTVVFTARTALSVAILVLSVALLVGATNNAFIYTRF
jgi:alginate O-acetyltransferase complex protein AlgI